MGANILITKNRFWLWPLGFMVLGATGAWAQPPTAPTTPSLLCSVDTASSFGKDTVASTPDSNGFYTIFNGTDMTGWWNNCESSHSQERVFGGGFQADPVQHAIYAMQRNGCYSPTGDLVSTSGSCASPNTNLSVDGGLLATHKKYGNYEIVFDWWPDYGNDGGIFNRFYIAGVGNVQANQMVMDYLDASGVLSYYSENWDGGRNGRPWSYTGANATIPGQTNNGDITLTIPGSGGNGGTLSNWTQSTQGLNPTKYGCAASGCVQSDYVRLWARHGWNQIRQKYYGGLSKGQTTSNTFVQSPPGTGDKIHGFTWFRTYYPTDTSLHTWNPTTMSTWVAGVTDTAQWIPVVQDSCALPNTSIPQSSRIAQFAFQEHGGGRYRTVAQGGKGSWMRNIRIRELDSLGVPLYLKNVVAVKNPAMSRAVQYENLHLVSGNLVGTMDLDHLVTIHDLKGRLIHQYVGMAGPVSYQIPANAGVLLVQVRSSRGMQTFRVDQASH